jgi:membrane protein YqaA with SNARE-associated domain
MLSSVNWSYKIVLKRRKSASTTLVAELKQSCRTNRDFSSLLLESFPVRIVILTGLLSGYFSIDIWTSAKTVFINKF